MSGVAQQARMLKASLADTRMADSFKAWRIAGTDKAWPIDLAGAGTLAEAVNAAKAGPLAAKDTLAIRHTEGRTGQHMVHIYEIKKSASAGFYRDALDGGGRVWVRGLVATLRCSFLAAAFDPVEPFRWTSGCDVVGIDRTLVEQR